MKSLPRHLRTWFIIHFWVDMLFAIPLFFFPIWSAQQFGFEITQPIFVRLTAAALFAIGGTSLFVRDESKDVYKALLMLKIIWSSVAIVGLVMATFTQPFSFPLIGTLLLFIIFSFVWRFYARKISLY